MRVGSGSKSSSNWGVVEDFILEAMGVKEKHLLWRDDFSWLWVKVNLEVMEVGIGVGVRRVGEIAEVREGASRLGWTWKLRYLDTMILQEIQIGVESVVSNFEIDRVWLVF